MSLGGTCAVCGRTILDGEQVHSYVSAQERHMVCELCAGHAAELGWLPAEQEGAEEMLRSETQRKSGVLARLLGGRERPLGDEDVTRARPLAAEESDTEDFDVEADWEVPAGVETNATSVARPTGRSVGKPVVDAGPAASIEPGPPAPLPDPADRGMRPRRPPVDLPPPGRFERAISRFNASEAGRTVAGLTRTLGAPSVSVGDSAGAADEVRVTVAWELTWYRWGVDLGDERRPVYELDRGFEVAEIDAAARQWNASAHDGRIVMIAPRRRAAAAGRPVRD